MIETSTNSSKAFLTKLKEDIEADQSVLENLLVRLDEKQSAVRKAGAWILEKFSRVKLQAKTKDNGLGMFQALEALALPSRTRACQRERQVAESDAGRLCLHHGVVVGFVIGVFICYQILYTDISDHLPQLATLKALGYQNSDLVRLVLKQAVLLGMLGFLPAVVMTLGLYSALAVLTGIVTKLTLARVGLVFALTLGMCLVSGLLAVRKALSVDPAELF